jgi:hypothetical protein
LILPSGKRLQNYGKSPFFMGKPTINGHVQWLFWHNQRVIITTMDPTERLKPGPDAVLDASKVWLLKGSNSRLSDSGMPPWAPCHVAVKTWLIPRWTPKC